MTPPRQAEAPPPQAPPPQGDAAEQLPQSVPTVQQSYENGNTITSRSQPAVAPSAEQHGMHELEQKLQEQEQHFEDQMQSMQRMLAEKEAGLHALQSQAAAARAEKDSMTSYLMQQKADNAEYHQRLQHMAAEHQRLSEARNLEWQSSNRSLQEQVCFSSTSECLLCWERTEIRKASTHMPHAEWLPVQLGRD